MSTRGAATRPARVARLPRKPISRSLIEVVVSRSVATFGLAFGAQTVPVALDQTQYSEPLWFLLVTVGFVGSLVLNVVASIVKRLVRTANCIVLLVFLAVLITWPLGLVEPEWAIMDRPWPWFLIAVATAAAAIALPVWLATLYSLIAPLLYGVIRSSPSGGSLSPALVSLDVIYAVILGGAILVIVTMLRGAAATVDTAQGAALARYSEAVSEHAIEVERVQVDSIVHDSVLTTLLSAAAARDAEAETLAATMASSAIGYLEREAAKPSSVTTDVSASALAHRIARAAGIISSTIIVRRVPLGDRMLPAPVAEALFSATLQAMVNSLQHAGDREEVSYWVSVFPGIRGGLQIEVGDTGCGFEVEQIPVERLGVRLSIIERVSNAGGVVVIDSVLGEGTAIRLSWPTTVVEPASVRERQDGEPA